jgi:hypothetical protein
MSFGTCHFLDLRSCQQNFLLCTYVYRSEEVCTKRINCFTRGGEVSSQFYHRSFIIAILSSQFYHRTASCNIIVFSKNEFYHRTAFYRDRLIFEVMQVENVLADL